MEAARSRAVVAAALLTVLTLGACSSSEAAKEAAPTATRTPAAAVTKDAPAEPSADDVEVFEVVGEIHSHEDGVTYNYTDGFFVGVLDTFDETEPIRLSTHLPDGEMVASADGPNLACGNAFPVGASPEDGLVLLGYTSTEGTQGESYHLRAYDPLTYDVRWDVAIPEAEHHCMTYRNDVVSAIHDGWAAVSGGRLVRLSDGHLTDVVVDVDGDDPPHWVGDHLTADDDLGGGQWRTRVVDPSTGEELYTVEPAYTYPVAVGDLVFDTWIDFGQVPPASGVRTVSAADGRELWSVRLPPGASEPADVQTGWPKVDAGASVALIAVDALHDGNDPGYVAGDGLTVVAFDLHTGDLLYEVPGSAVCASNGRVVAVSGVRGVVLHNVRTGEEVASTTDIQGCGSGMSGDFAVYDDVVVRLLPPSVSG